MDEDAQIHSDKFKVVAILVFDSNAKACAKVNDFIRMLLYIIAVYCSVYVNNIKKM